MNKNLGSKKKARKAAFLDREAKRNSVKLKRSRYIDAINSGNIETMANAMGIKLK